MGRHALAAHGRVRRIAAGNIVIIQAWLGLDLGHGVACSQERFGWQRETHP
jgi:hypothetical protein